MSWLNLNESLNSIKGQLSSFASGVLADVKETENDAVPKRTVISTFETSQLINKDEAQQIPKGNGTSSWSWESPEEPLAPQSTSDDVISSLQKKIEILEKEKEELVVGLEQLDLDCQQTTDKLVALKDNLQSDYNELKANYVKLQKEYGEVLNENMKKTNEIETLKINDVNSQGVLCTCKKLKEETVELNLKIKDNCDKLELLRSENDTLLKKIKDLKETEEELGFKNKDLIEENDELKKVIEIARNVNNEDNKRLIEENNSLRQKLNDQNGIIGENKKNLATLMGDFEMLKNEYENIKLDSQKLSENLKNENQQFDLEKGLEDSSKEVLHQRYLSIITETIKQYIDDSDVSSKILDENEEPLTLEFANKIKTLLKILLDFKMKTESLEKELCLIKQEKNEIITDKNFEIEKLLKNSEILSQEVITKTQAIKDYEDECAELMKNNDLLISELQNLKSNSSGLQTISESNEDNMLLLESQLENANKRIQDLELIISDLENSKQDVNLETQTELEYIKKQLNMTGQELSHSKEEYQHLLSRYNDLEMEKSNLKSNLDKIKTDYENIEYKYTEANINLETLKEENEVCKYNNKNLESLNLEITSKNDFFQNAIDDLKQEYHLQLENSKQKDIEIRSLIERLQDAKMNETKLKLQIDTSYKELQSITEAKQALEVKHTENNNKLKQLEEKINGESKDVESKENLSLQQVNLNLGDNQIIDIHSELENANKEKNYVLLECAELKKNLSEIMRQNYELQQKNSVLESQLGEISTSRNELVNFVMTKHQENIQYHNEIQRLNHLLSLDAEKIARLEAEISKLSANPQTEDLEQKTKEIEKLIDQNAFLHEKCEVLTQNFIQEQSISQNILAEQKSAVEKEQSLAKELDRLRAHLVEIEDMYTQELLQAEQKNKEMQMKVNEMEQREKDSNSICTSVSIRANQQVETLQTQVQLVTNQRDELRTKVSDLEDQNNKQAAALTNLQSVLEQFQREKEKDVYQETERIRRQITAEKQLNKSLQDEIQNLKFQLEESKQGLQAASRLSDQLEKSKQQIVSLKDEVSKLQEQLNKSDVKYKELSTQADTKVDKSLIKNLIIGYISSQSHDQRQVLKIIATVLDFNQAESSKVNLNKPEQGGWLSAILHPQNANPNRPMSQQSLSEAFVRFLENESRPKELPNLLATTSQRSERRASNSSSFSMTPRQSPTPLVLNEMVLPTLVDFNKSRNSSSILKDVLKDNT